MRWGWLFGEFADADFVLSRAERRAITRLPHERFVPPSALLKFTMWAVLQPALLAFIALPLLLQWLGLGGRNLPFIVSAGVICLLSWPWAAFVYAKLYARPCREAMRAMGRSVCIGCGYCLEGLDPANATVCPECGG